MIYFIAINIFSISWENLRVILLLPRSRKYFINAFYSWKSKTRVTSSNPQVTSSSSRVRRLEARVGRLKARVRILKARVEAIKPRVR